MLSVSLVVGQDITPGLRVKYWPEDSKLGNISKKSIEKVLNSLLTKARKSSSKRVLNAY